MTASAPGRLALAALLTSTAVRLALAAALPLLAFHRAWADDRWFDWLATGALTGLTRRSCS